MLLHSVLADPRNIATADRRLPIAEAGAGILAWPRPSPEPTTVGLAPWSTSPPIRPRGAPNSDWYSDGHKLQRRIKHLAEVDLGLAAAGPAKGLYDHRTHCRAPVPPVDAAATTRACALLPAFGATTAV